MMLDNLIMSNIAYTQSGKQHKFYYQEDTLLHNAQFEHICIDSTHDL